MAPNILLQEICRTIVRWADNRDWPILARTSRALQTEAEARIYGNLEFYHSHHVFVVMRVIADCPRVAKYVRSLVLIDDRNRHRRRHFYGTNAYEWYEKNRDYWTVLRGALLNMVNLDFLYLVDPLLENSWIFGPEEQTGSQTSNSDHTENTEPTVARKMRFQVREARLFTLFTPAVASFLEDQREIRSLLLHALADGAPRPPLSSNSLPKLSTFDGPLILIDQLYHCSLTHLRVPLQGEDSLSLLPIALPEFCRFKKLRSLYIGPIPERTSIVCIDLISTACPNLQYLALLPFPTDITKRYTFLKCLRRLQYLYMLELDINIWNPPLYYQLQRPFVIEIQMCAPRIRHVCFWNDTDSWQWVWSMDHVRLAPLDVVQQEEPEGDSGGASARTGKKKSKKMDLGLSPCEEAGPLAWRCTATQGIWSLYTNTWRCI